jgi:hypothetical protein
VATDPDTADWAALSALDEASREQAMRSRFRELLALSPDERIAAEQDMLIAEESLETQEHGAMTLSRLRAWMSFDAAEIEALVAGRETAREQIPGSAAMRSVMGLQSVIQQLSAEEISRLIEAAPSMRKALPAEVLDSLDALAQHDQPLDQVPEESAQSKWWQFWRR